MGYIARLYIAIDETACRLFTCFELKLANVVFIFFYVIFLDDISVGWDDVLWKASNLGLPWTN